MHTPRKLEQQPPHPRRPAPGKRPTPANGPAPRRAPGDADHARRPIDARGPDDHAPRPVDARGPDDHAPRPVDAPAAAEAPLAYALQPRALDFDGPFDTALFHDLGALRARTTIARELAAPSIALARGYDAATLFALAEIGHHYVLSGGSRIALVIFEGLAAIAPTEPYFALALGYALDRAGRTDDAIAAYRRAIQLAPDDGHAELNLAELLLASGDRAAARHHLARAERAAHGRGDRALAQKARAILSRIG